LITLSTQNREERLNKERLWNNEIEKIRKFRDHCAELRRYLFYLSTLQDNWDEVNKSQNLEENWDLIHIEKALVKKSMAISFLLYEYSGSN